MPTEEPPISLPGPQFVVMDYFSEKMPHKMTIPIRAWTPPSEGAPLGQALNWENTPVDVYDQLGGLATLLADICPTTVSFVGGTVYTQASPEVPAKPRAAASFEDPIPGTDATPGEYLAVQTTITFRDTEFHVFKLTVLDSGSNNSFAPVRATGVSAQYDAIIAEVLSDLSIWQSRYELQPMQFLQVAKTLNEKLRRAYRLN